MATLKEDIELIRRELTQWYADGAYCLPGVPTKMKADPNSDEEWCDWKMIPSTYTLSDISAFEARLPAPLPPFFKAYILSNHVMDFDFGEYTFPGLKSDRTLDENFAELLHAAHWDIGFILIGSGRGCGDPIFMDFMSPTADGDYPVSIFNHDVVPRSFWTSREKLERYNSIVARSVRDYFFGLLHGDETLFPAPQSLEELRRNDAWARVRELLVQQGLDPYHRPAGIPSDDPWAIAQYLRNNNKA